jgi:hypothetical protein
MSASRFLCWGVPADSSDSVSIDDQIAYHAEMEHVANRAGDFTKAEHHKKMREILISMKSGSYKTPEQITDEDYKVAPTSADKEQLK